MRATAAEVAAWMERRLVVAQGRRRGSAFKVLPWELEVLRKMEREPEISLSVARGNGKSVLCGAIAAAVVHPEGPLHQPAADVIVVASSADQARLVFDAARALLFPGEPPARREWVNVNNHVRRLLQHKATGSALRCISSDPRRAHGLQPALVLADEPAQWPPSTSDAMLAALRTARGKLEGSRFVALGTRPADPGHWFERMLSTPGGICYAGDPEADPLDETQWAAANPSLPYFPDLRRAIEHEAKAAAQDPMQLASFRALRLNAGVAETKVEYVIDPSDWSAIEVDNPRREGPCYWGLDLSGGQAMAAIAAYWPGTGALECIGVFPERPTLQARGVEDSVGDLYVQMAERGELLTLGGRVPDVALMLDEARDLWGTPVAVAADNFKRRELADAVEGTGFRCRRFVFRKGLGDWFEDLRSFRAAVLEREVEVARSLLLRSALREARVKVSGQGSRLARKAEAGRRERGRDDPIVASLLAVSLGRKMKRQPQRRSGRVLVG